MKNDLRTAYFAGLIDGEGTVDVFSYKQGTKLRPVIKVDMTCERTIRALHDYFGGYIGPKKTHTAHKPQWRWEVTFANAVRVCQLISPHLITKSEGASRVLQCPMNKPGRPKKTIGGGSF